MFCLFFGVDEFQCSAIDCLNQSVLSGRHVDKDAGFGDLGVSSYLPGATLFYVQVSATFWFFCQGFSCGFYWISGVRFLSLSWFDG